MLSRILKNKPFCNDAHYLLIAVILLFISLKYNYFFILLSLYLIFILLKTKYFIHTLALIIIFISLLSFNELKLKHNENDNYIGTIIQIKNENSYIIRSGSIKILVYDKNSYEVGDEVSVSGSINEIAPKGYPGDFDYEEYLKSKGISYSFYASNSNKIGKKFTLNNLKYRYLNYLKGILNESSFKYVEGVVFGDNLLDGDLKDSYGALGISHILAISGMHILLLYKVISFILLKLFNYYKKNIPLAIIAIYVLIIGSPPSAMRALLFLLLSRINDSDSLKYTKLDILSISFIFMLILNPYQIYSLGFILSYLVSFILIFMNDLVDDSSLKGILKSYVFIYLITLPFIINMSNQISILSLILSPILSLIITYLLLPISYILAIVPILDRVFKYFYLLLNGYIINLGGVLPIIKMPYLNPILMFLYYLLFLYLVIKIAKKERGILPFSLIAFYLFLIKIVVVYNPFTTMTFLDCGQGDSTIIKDSDSVIVVDAFNSFDYLKDLGIDRIDYLILTHSDSDHLGDYVEILDYFEVSNILYPSYDSKLQDLLLNYDAYGIEAGYSFKTRNVSVNFLSPTKNYNDGNMNSLVMDLSIKGSKALLCGDITKEVESDLVEIYGSSLRCDILKAPHHGSATSSSIEFLKTTKPKYSIISAGLNNRYNHPDPSVYDRLSSLSLVYSTIDSGSISFFFKNGGYFISTYR